MAIAPNLPYTPRNVLAADYISLTDPALDAENGVQAGKTWTKVNADPPTDFTQVLGRFVRNLANAVWVPASLGEGGGPGEEQQQNFVVSGGQVVHKTGLTFIVSAASYSIGGTLYSSPQTEITLDAADATHPRIDLIVVTTGGAVATVTGTPAATPAEPDSDSATELQLTFVLVPNGSSTPSGVTLTNVWQEGVEWTDVSSSGNIVLESLNNPFAGTKSIEATAAVSGNLVTFTAPGAVDINQEALLVVQVRSKAAWASTRILRFYFRSAGVRVGSFVLIRPTGTYGFVSSQTASYQQIAIPIGDFRIPVGTTIADLRMEVAGSGTGIGFYADSIVLQKGVAQGLSSKMTWRGAWSSATAYVANDVVTTADALYVAVLAGTNKPPASSPTHWTKLATLLASTPATVAQARYETLMLAVSDETTNLVAGTAKLTLRLPAGWGACTVTGVSASLSTASSSGLVTVDINEGGVSILSTKLTIDQGEETSDTAAAPPVISDSALAQGAEITVDIDDDGTGAKGLKVYIELTRSAP